MRLPDHGRAGHGTWRADSADCGANASARYGRTGARPAHARSVGHEGVPTDHPAALRAWLYLEVHCTYNLLSNYSYNPNISPITTVTVDIIGLELQLLSRL